MEEQGYFAHKYIAEVTANRAVQESREYADAQLKLYMKHMDAKLEAIRETASVLKADNSKHFDAVNNFNNRFRELGSEMATKEELKHEMAYLKERIQKLENGLTKLESGLAVSKYLLAFMISVITIVLTYLAIR